ncbi:MAG: hypothetical protein KA230_12410 [Flavobacteriales bacterium]|nr:hypothetical protein [Flavobacteriales bacterium]
MKSFKNLTTLVLASASLLITAPASAAAPRQGREVRINTENLVKLSPEDQERVLEIKSRLEVLMATDRSSITTEQRGELRTEWNGLKREMEQFNQNGNVIYISTAGLIIIILLLIILL